MQRAFFLVGMTYLSLGFLTCIAAAGQSSPPSDDGKILILLLKSGADMTRFANIVAGVNGTVMNTQTIQATGQQLLKVQVPAGTSAGAQQSIEAAADPDIIGGGQKLLLAI
jgi:hypothetical protein